VERLISSKVHNDSKTQHLPVGGGGNVVITTLLRLQDTKLHICLSTHLDEFSERRVTCHGLGEDTVIALGAVTTHTGYSTHILTIMSRV